MAVRVRGATVVGLVVLTGLAAAAAAAQSERSPAGSTAAAPDRAGAPARRPMIAIRTPRAGATVHGSTIRVSVSLRNFKLHEQFRPPVAGQGHVHFYLDVEKLPTTHAYPSPVPYRSISGSSYAWAGVRSGRHVVAVQLVGNDHVPLRPPVTDRVTVTVH
jgi:hypothetical protein